MERIEPSVIELNSLRLTLGRFDERVEFSSEDHAIVLKNKNDAVDLRSALYR